MSEKTSKMLLLIEAVIFLVPVSALTLFIMVERWLSRRAGAGGADPRTA